MRSLRVSVPAQIAGIGPAVASRGLALGLRDQFLLEPVASSQVSVSVLGREKNSQPSDARNLVITALHAAQDYLGAPRFGLRLSIDTFIPRQRGLGSAVASVAAGVAGALAFSGHSPQVGGEDFLHSVFDLTARLLSRPVGAATAVYGGLTNVWHTEPSSDVPRSVVTTGASPITGRAFLTTYHEGWHAASSPVDAAVDAYLFLPLKARADALTPVPADTTPSSGRDPALEILRRESGLRTDVPADLLVSALTRSALLAPVLASPRTASANERLYEATQADLTLGRLRPLLPDAVQLCEHLRSLGYAAFIAGKGPTVAVLRAGTDDVALVAARLRGLTASEWLAGGRWTMVHTPLSGEGIEVDPLD